MLGIIAVAVLHFTSKSESLPHSVPLELSIRTVNITGPSDPPWVPAPSGRGTYGLYSSCLTTLALCLYTAIYLNINPDHWKVRSFLWRPLWVVFATFGPELILWLAFDQWYTARLLYKQVNKIGTRWSMENQVPNTVLVPVDCPCTAIPASEGNSIGVNNESTQPLVQRSPKPFKSWNMTQGFYAVAGGYAVNMSSVWARSPAIFTPAGMIELAKAGLLPELSEEEVEDKSKASMVAKVFVCVQAGWFCIQSIARLANGLPLTLLEIHTLTHVACAFGMYFLWFKKPYDVGRPSICEDPLAIDLVALFTLGTDNCPRPMDRRCCQTSVIELPQVSAWRGGQYVDENYLALLEPANRTIARLKELGSHFCWGISDKNQIILDRKYFVHSQSNFFLKGRATGPSNDAENTPPPSVVIFLPVAYGCYGAAHLAAWRSHFPTNVEMWMWLGSCLLLVVAPVLILLLYPAMLRLVADEEVFVDEQGVTRPFGISKIRRICNRIINTLNWTFVIVSVFLGSAMPMARLYVLAETLASLRSPPVGTYKTVDWLNFIPHFS